MYADNPCLQTLQKDIRKFLLQDIPSKDIDMVNCQSVLLQHEATIRGFNLSFIEKYNADREKCIVDYKLRNKEGIYGIIFNENYTGTNPEIREFHNRLYTNFFPAILQQNAGIFKSLLAVIKKKNKKNKNSDTYNVKGSFMAYYLQNIENNILNHMIDFSKSKKVEIRSLAFDGMIVDDSPKTNDRFLKDMEGFVKLQSGIDIKLKYKSLVTDYAFQFPILNPISTSERYLKSVSSKLLQDTKVEGDDGEVAIDRDAHNIFIDYMNKFCCVFDYPHTYGVKFNLENEIQLRTSSTLKERIGPVQFIEWNNSDNQKCYSKMDFVIDIDTPVSNNIYNIYKRPKWTAGVGSLLSLKTVMPLLFDYLFNVISDGEESKYIFTLDWISVMIKYGKTKKCLVFMGDKGAGKSFFSENLIAPMLGNNDHFRIIKDLKSVKDNFNAREQFNICSVIEEVSEAGAEFHQTQQILKTLICAETADIRKMHTDAFPCKSNSNYIICTNYNNPVIMSKDNRRFQPYKISNCKLNNTVFFEELYSEIHDNVEWLRGFFIERRIIDRKLNIHDSPLIAEMVINCERPHERFIRNELDYFYQFHTNNETVGVMKDDIYLQYKIYCNNVGDKSLSWSRLKSFINTTSDKYKTVLKEVDGRRTDYIIERTI